MMPDNCTKQSKLATMVTTKPDESRHKRSQTIILVWLVILYKEKVYYVNLT